MEPNNCSSPAGRSSFAWSGFRRLRLFRRRLPLRHDGVAHGRSDQAALLAKAHRVLPVIDPTPARSVIGDQRGGVRTGCPFAGRSFAPFARSPGSYRRSPRPGRGKSGGRVRRRHPVASEPDGARRLSRGDPGRRFRVRRERHRQGDRDAAAANLRRAPGSLLADGPARAITRSVLEGLVSSRAIGRCRGPKPHLGTARVIAAQSATATRARMCDHHRSVLEFGELFPIEQTSRRNRRRAASDLTEIRRPTLRRG
jgi:hypothetical protein